jgi:hypothetical protein
MAPSLYLPDQSYTRVTHTSGLCTGTVAAVLYAIRDYDDRPARKPASGTAGKGNLPF